MPIWAWVLIGVAALALVALLALAFRWRRTRQLRERFGPEYDRTLERTGTRRGAEAELSSRVDRREQLEIRPLTPQARDGYLESWRSVQAQFVDAPGEAVRAADQLVITVMTERGYPMNDFEGRSADVSVDHPQVVERYRSAHGIAQKNSNGTATTEDLRQAMQHYRALFEDLLEPAEDEPLAREPADKAQAEAEEPAVRQ